jgi:uncharacterized membrane protein
VGKVGLKQSAYGPATTALTEGYTGRGLDLYDRLGLKISALLAEEDAFEVMFTNFFTDMVEEKIGCLPIDFSLNGTKQSIHGRDSIHIMNVVADFFKLLTDLVNDERLVMNRIIRTIDYDREANVNTNGGGFYRESVMREMLSYCYVVCPATIEALQGKLARISADEKLREEFIDSHIVINKSNRMADLSKKHRDNMSIEQVDLHFMWHDEVLANEFLERAQSKANSKPLNPLHSNVSNSLFAQKLVEKFASPGFFGLLGKMLDLVTILGKQNDKACTALLKFMLFLVDSISPDNTLLKIKAISEISKAFKTVEKRVFNSEVRNRFTKRIEELNEEFLNAMSIESLPADHKVTGLSHKERVEQKFNKLRERLFAKLKRNREKYLAANNIRVEDFMQDLNAGQKEETLCIVTREPLTDQKTYFLYSQCHMSNLSTSFIYSTLKNLRPDQESPEAKEALFRWTEESRCKFTVVVKGCEHVISNDKLCSHKQKTAVCSTWEYPCIICNMPSSIRLPIYSRQLVEILTAPAPVGNPFVLLDMMDIFNTSNPVLETLLYFNKMRFSPSQLEIIHAEYETTKASITQMMGFISSFHKIEKNEAKIESGFPITSLSATRCFILSFIEILQLVQIKGLVQCVQQFGRAYHSIYLMFVVNAVVSYSSLMATSEDAAKLKEIEVNRNKNKLEIEQCVIACKEVMIAVNAMFHSEEVLRSKNICRLYTVLISHMVDRLHPASTLGPRARRCSCLPCIY